MTFLLLSTRNEHDKSNMERVVEDSKWIYCKNDGIVFQLLWKQDKAGTVRTSHHNIMTYVIMSIGNRWRDGRCV